MAKRRYAKKKRQIKRKIRRKRGYVTQGIGTAHQPRRQVFSSGLVENLPKTGGKTLKYFDTNDMVQLKFDDQNTGLTTVIDWTSPRFQYYITCLNSAENGTNVNGIKQGVSQSQRIGHKVFPKQVIIKMRLGQEGYDGTPTHPRQSAGAIVVRVVVVCDRQANNTLLTDARNVFRSFDGDNDIGGTIAQRNMQYYKRYDVLYDAKKVIRAPQFDGNSALWSSSYTYCDITLPLKNTIIYTPDVVTGLPTDVVANNYYLLVLTGSQDNVQGEILEEIGTIRVGYTARLLYTD